MPELPEQTPNIEGQSAGQKVCASCSGSTSCMLYVLVAAWLLCCREGLLHNTAVKAHRLDCWVADMALAAARRTKAALHQHCQDAEALRPR